MELVLKILSIINLVLMMGGVVISLHQLYTDVENKEEEEDI